MGHDYLELPNVIAINIVNFDFLSTENFHAVFRLIEEKEHSLVLTDALEIHFINMVKYRRLGRKDIRNEPLHRWLAWFDESSPPDLVREVVEMDSAIQEADERMVYVTGDDEAIRAYEMRQMALSDLTSMRNFGRREGYAEGEVIGEARGRAENNLEIARKMKALGDSPEKIEAITGLSPQTIAGL
jgi:predicted transposase/invertase (TIGR01784 family)